ncbi:MAG: restriction endonuclease [Phycisphaerae bacterium]|nr:restriction endonuclease [Phycisphaerae bacterium]
MSSELDSALRQFEGAEANLVKLERLWSDIAKLTPDGISFLDTSPDAIAYEDHCRVFRSILPHLPAIDGWSVNDELLDLDQIAQARLDALESGELDYRASVERTIVSQGVTLREYRFRLNAARRRLVRSAVLELLPAIGTQVQTLKRISHEMNDTRVINDSTWDELKDSVKKLDLLLGNSIERPPQWAELHRHLSFGQKRDVIDIVERDWPLINAGITASLYANNEPVPVEVADLGALSGRHPRGPVATSLRWGSLNEEDFERLVFCLICDARGYENPQWLTHTNAADRGRDLSVFRVHDDVLGGLRRCRVIIQCKHWLSKSVGLRDVSLACDQTKLWEPPRVDTLVIVTSGRFTTDAVQFIEGHNTENGLPLVEMWPESHLERLLAERPHVVAEFNLR